MSHADILRAFRPEAEVESVTPVGSGHIHDTYAVTLRCDGQAEDLILQRINTDVFRDVAGLMANIEAVTAHLRGRLAPGQESLTLIPTAAGASTLHDADGAYWRLMVRVAAARSVDVAESPEQIHEVARAYGAFLAQCVGLDPAGLCETIPDFHNGLKRVRDFREVLVRDPVGRAAGAQREIDTIRDQTGVFATVAEQQRRGRLPRRVTHNDTKLNNVLLDRVTGRARCVIDLDTVMPGLALYDFGDLVRTTATDAAEDESDLSRVVVHADRLEAARAGYLEGAGGCLTPVERDGLLLGVDFMPLIMAVRFLTDYLAGDVYYKTTRPSHNLDRCRTQLRMREQLLTLARA